MPVRVGHLIQAPEIAQNAVMAQVRLRFLADDNRVGAAASPAQYLSNDLYLDCPQLIDGTVQDEIVRPQEVLDNYTGVISYSTPWTCPRRRRLFRRVLRSPQERMDLLAWLQRRNGQYRPFWMPTWTRDLTLLTTGALTTTITVRNDGYSGCREHLAVRTKAGVWLPRAITEAQVVSDNLQLTLDTSLGIDASAVDLISYIGLHRLASDRIEIESVGGGWSHTAIPVEEVAG